MQSTGTEIEFLQTNTFFDNLSEFRYVKKSDLSFGSYYNHIISLKNSKDNENLGKQDLQD